MTIQSTDNHVWVMLKKTSPEQVNEEGNLGRGSYGEEVFTAFTRALLLVSSVISNAQEEEDNQVVLCI